MMALRGERSSHVRMAQYSCTASDRRSLARSCFDIRNKRYLLPLLSLRLPPNLLLSLSLPLNPSPTGWKLVPVRQRQQRAQPVGLRAGRWG